MALTHFLESLRAADDDRKKGWVVILTTVMMLMIVFIWLTWFNNLNVSNSNTTATIGTEPQDHGFSFFESLKLSFNAFRQKFAAPRDYIIKPNQ